MLVFPAKLGACDTSLSRLLSSKLSQQDDVDTVDLMFEITKISDGPNDVLEWLDTNAPVDYVDRFITLGELFSVE